MSTEICFFFSKLIDQFNHELINQKIEFIGEKKHFAKPKHKSPYDINKH